ncbi:MFS transporter, partial [Bacillus toyonensis]|nr:MFS transporter [Bacillus toyonensis]
LMVRTIILRIGLSFISMPLHTAGLNALPIELGSHGSAVNNTIRQLAGAIGTAVIIAVYTIQSTSHISQLSSGNGNVTATQVTKLSSIFSSSDAYVFMLVLSFIALIIASFMPKKVVIKRYESKPSNIK